MFKILREYWTINRSGLFDSNYYLLNYPDVRRADIDPLMHFVRFGWREGRNPSERFDIKYYLTTYPDVKAAGINPLVHYIKYGKKEGRSPTGERILKIKAKSIPEKKKVSIYSYKVIEKIRKHGFKNVVKRGGDILRYEGIHSFINNLFKKAVERTSYFDRLRALNPDQQNEIIVEQGNILIVPEVLTKVMVDEHCPVEIVICVHNALDDFKKCIGSIRKSTSSPYHINIVDDGSDQETKDFLNRLNSSDESISLYTNAPSQGYTKSANLGLRESKAKYIVLMNSDVIVTPGWLEEMISVYNMNSKIGIVGPMSNTASWQSIPQLFEGNDWAKNLLPDDFSINQFALALSKLSCPVYPKVPFLNGFCMMIRREVLTDIGYFDETAFPIGYGEEDDFIIRARKAGWEIRWSDNTYIFHAQSRSFTDAKRLELSSRGMKSLVSKHGESIISEGCQFLTNSLTLNGIREHSKHIIEREKLIELGKKLFQAKRVLFVLPIAEPGGGANVVFDEASAMINMGVDVRIFNLEANKLGVVQGYPDLEIPITYGDIGDLKNLIPLFDAVVATANISVEWIKNNLPPDGKLVFGYYVQGFEPLIYESNSGAYRRALASYNLDPRIIRFTKTEWTRKQVLENVGVDSINIGISVNSDLFRPIKDVQNHKVIRIGAMIRTSTSYRAPELTVKVLREIERRFAGRVEIRFFGSDIHDEMFQKLPLDFSWKTAGVLTQKQVVNFLNELDIFCDFSSHQAMGLTTLEAMSCGCCVLVPQNGGSVEFINNGENGIVVDTTSTDECISSLCDLIDKPKIIDRIRQEAIVTANNFFVENSALKILSALFGNRAA